MSFISIEFIILFVTVFLIFFKLPQKFRWILLLIASYIFYMYTNAYHIFIIIFSTVVDFFVSQRMGKLPEEEQSKRRMLLLASVLVNLGVLFYFKYFNFFGESVTYFFLAIGLDTGPIEHSQILPVGISFYTFQSMAYTFDVYRGKIKPEPHFGIFATYIAFFPQLVAGPIERAGNMLPQFREKFDFDYDRIVSGLRLALFGMFKKIVIADRLAVYVNEVYNNPGEYSGIVMIVATVFFAYQIYCDFSGYSDIAIGIARVLGFDLMKNFNHPYLAHSIRDFWRRWHISLSTWFRDYVYIPLGGNRVSLGRNVLNLFIVFVVSGLWHGASWTFVIWGAIHGAYIVVETLIASRSPNKSRSFLSRAAGMLLTFTIVNITWIFFRANSLDDALYILQNMFNFENGMNGILVPFLNQELGAPLTFLIAIASIAGLQLFEFFNEYWKVVDTIARHLWLRWAFYYGALMLIIITLSDLSVEQNFIYFQF